MQLATILPTHYLDMIAEKEYHMALAHLIGKDEKYTEFYKNQAMELSHFVILDNSVIEDDQQSIEDLCRKADIIGATEIILPDVFMNSDATLESTLDALNYVKLHYPEMRLMVVPQGETYEEWLECAKILIGWDIHTIGIPKVLTKMAGRDARLKAIMDLNEYSPKLMRSVEIHLLGCWSNPIELTMIEKAVQAGAIPPIRGCDSAIAYVYARDAMLITQGPRPSGKIDFNAKDVAKERLKQNIGIWEDSVDLVNNKVTKIYV